MPATEHKRAIRIYRAEDAVDLSETDFMILPESPPKPVDDNGRTAIADAVVGYQIKVLARDTGGFSLVHVWFKGHYPLPRHSHNTDCMYYVISGVAIMGRQKLRAGDSFFVPANAPYQYTAGPEGVEVLEVRYGADHFDARVVDGAGRGEVLAKALAANREQWAKTQISPTFAANSG
jgi:mannose-6-phosphate isomerase-like protein (cupin superfamily)